MSYIVFIFVLAIVYYAYWEHRKKFTKNEKDKDTNEIEDKNE